MIEVFDPFGIVCLFLLIAGPGVIVYGIYIHISECWKNYKTRKKETNL